MISLIPCETCGAEFQPKRKDARFCSKPCCKKWHNKHNCELGRLLGWPQHNIKERGVGSGNSSVNKKGPANKAYISGIGGEWRRHKKDACQRCGSTRFLLVHHIDENRHNNIPENLETLCKRCHQEHHCNRNHLGQYA